MLSLFCGRQDYEKGINLPQNVWVREASLCHRCQLTPCWVVKVVTIQQIESRAYINPSDRLSRNQGGRFYSIVQSNFIACSPNLELWT